MVESEFKPKVRSRTNNAGLWQLEPITARLHGLKVNSKVDERLDPKKSTAAACRYITSLRQTLGPDTSLLVTVAAYNLGPSRLQSRMKTVSNSDRQKDFWHLYSTRRIPALTRTHIARLMAAIIVGRNQERFGFGPAANDRQDCASKVWTRTIPEKRPRWRAKLPYNLTPKFSGLLPPDGNLPRSSDSSVSGQSSSLHRSGEEAWVNFFHDLVHRLFNNPKEGLRVDSNPERHRHQR